MPLGRAARPRPLAAIAAIAGAATLFFAAHVFGAPDPLPPPGTIAAPQQQLEAPVGPPPELATLDLVLLPSDYVTVHYPPAALDRAARFQKRLELLQILFSKVTPNSIDWGGILLRRDQWESAKLAGTYGAPFRLAPGRFAGPAEGDARTVELARALVGGTLPDPGGDPILGTRDEAGSLIVSDFLLQLEAAKDFAEMAPLAGDRPWVTGVLTQLALRLAWERIEPGMVLPYVGLYDGIAAAHGGPRAHRLDEYRPDLPYEVDLWYQAQFVRGADALWVELGNFGTERRLYKWIKKGEPIRLAELERKYPALVEWQRANFP